MSWIEVSLDTTHEAVDWVNTLLATTDYQGDVSITSYSAPPDNQSDNQSDNQPDDQDYPDRNAVPSSWAFTIRLYVLNQGTAGAQIEAIARLFSPLHRTGMATLLKIVVLEEKPDSMAMPVSSGHRIGQRFLVVPELITPATADPTADPTADRPQPATGSSQLIPLQVPTSRAFGSGLHPTTIVSLRLLERYVSPEINAIDFGSGSGILAVAMAKLGATVLALDNDSVAAAATQDIVRLNGVELQVTVARGSLGTGSDLGHWMGGELAEPVTAIDAHSSFTSRRFDLIVANIPARIHLALVENFRQALRPSGLLIVAGFTTDYEAEISAALINAGFAIIDCERSDEWVALVGQLTATHQ